MCSYKWIQPEEIMTSVWSGGTTTQLAIYPSYEKYADRAFLWRLSSATVEDEKSEFTSLADYDRLILMQRGTVTLTHNDGDEIFLPPWKVHFFDGGARTISIGKAMDFNMMLRKGAAEGRIEVLLIKAGESVELSMEEGQTKQFTAVYSSEGALDITTIDKEQKELKTGGLFLMEGWGNVLIRNHQNQDIHMIVSRIKSIQ